MASIFKTPIGEMNQFIQNLHSAGFTDADVARVIRDPGLASAMYLAIQPKVTVAIQSSGDMPTWWRTPEQQLARARQLWPDLALPEPPAQFVPLTKTEVLLLHVPDTFDSLWDKVTVPEGSTKYRQGINTDKSNMRLVPKVPEYTKAVWLAFDPEHGRGLPPNLFWGQSDLATTEVFSALIQFPDWPLAWFNGASAPHISGYVLNHRGNWSLVPFLDRTRPNHHVALCATWADIGRDAWASPTVREC